MTTATDHHVVPHEPAQLPALAAADRGVASSLEAVLSDNTRRTYAAQWRIFDGWCDQVGLRSLPAEPLTVARYLAARAGSGASIATLRLAASAISKAHEWAKLESPCRDPGVRASLKGWSRRLSRPHAASRGAMARRHHYNYQMGMGYAVTDFEDGGLKLEGTVLDTTKARAGEQNQRGFYSRWREFMAARDWDELATWRNNGSAC